VAADNQHPLPHATKGQPANNVGAVVVGFPPIVCSSAQPIPILLVIVFVVVVVFVFVAVVFKQALPLVFPTFPSLPIPSCHCPRSNTSANPSGSLEMYNPWSMRRMLIARLDVSSPNGGPVQMITSLRMSPLL
jgi:hypothetical protein